MSKKTLVLLAFAPLLSGVVLMAGSALSPAFAESTASTDNSDGGGNPNGGNPTGGGNPSNSGNAGAFAFILQEAGCTWERPLIVTRSGKQVVDTTQRLRRVCKVQSQTN